MPMQTALSETESDIVAFPPAFEVTDAEPLAVSRWLRDGEALLVDLRETSEYEAERIPGALLIPMSFFDAEQFPRLPGLRVVLMCAVGKRSAAAGKQLLKAGFPEAIHLRGGLTAWKEAGLATEF